MLYWLKSWLRKWLAVDAPAIAGEPARLPRTIEEGAADLVERSRAGDQVAMSQMILIRKTAEEDPKNEKAKKSFAALISYTKANPIKMSSAFGAELKREGEANRLANLMCSTMGSEEYPRAIVNIAPEIAKNSLPKAIVTLANGPTLLTTEEPLIQAIADSIEDPHVRAAFALGVKHKDQALAQIKALPPQCQAMLKLGYLLGEARSLQAVRVKGAPISTYCCDAGWEMGEGPDVQ